MQVNPFIKIDNDSYKRLSAYITGKYGIKLPPSKKALIESRLYKKIKGLGFDNYKMFTDYIFSKNGNPELAEIIDLITTNKTDFFREQVHFQYLTENFLPTHTREHGYKNLKVWSAGCSTGEEPYSIVMTLEEFRKRHSGLSYSVLASDISFRVLTAAYHGIYHSKTISNIPADLKRNYFLKSKEIESKLVRIKPDYRKKVTFKRINLIDNSSEVAGKSMDIIFCRNVLIYFDRATQEKVINTLAACLRPGGLLFLGHSESIMGMNVPLRPVKPTIYQLAHGRA